MKVEAIYELIAEDYNHLRETMQLKTEIISLRGKFQTGSPCILDAGCGPGRDIDTFLNLNFKTYGVDLTRKFVSMAQNRNSKAIIEHGDIKNLNYRRSFFDAVWCCAVLSHIKKEDIPNVFLEFNRIIKTGGYLSILVREGSEYQFIEDDFKGVKRLFTNFNLNEITSLIEKAGFFVVEHNKFNERDRFGSKCRDLNYIFVQAMKLTKAINTDI